MAALPTKTRLVVCLGVARMRGFAPRCCLQCPVDQYVDACFTLRRLVSAGRQSWPTLLRLPKPCSMAISSNTSGMYHQATSFSFRTIPIDHVRPIQLTSRTVAQNTPSVSQQHVGSPAPTTNHYSRHVRILPERSLIRTSENQRSLKSCRVRARPVHQNCPPPQMEVLFSRHSIPICH